METRSRKASLSKAAAAAAAAAALAASSSSTKEPALVVPSSSKRQESPENVISAQTLEDVPEEVVVPRIDHDIFNAAGKRIPRLRVMIHEWRAVANWRWKDADEDDCGICRSPFSACCNDCKFPGDECPIVVGKCTHTFHVHCIHRWLQSQQQQRQTCPMCRQEWSGGAFLA